MPRSPFLRRRAPARIRCGPLPPGVIEDTDQAGSTVDSYHQSVGVWTVAADGTRFLVNGEPVQLTGFSMHEA